MPSTELTAGTIAYREAGPAEGRPVVFVHGFLVDATLWADVPERLADRGYRTFAPTWPLGSHRTPMRAGADLSPRGVARVVIDFLEHHDLRDVVLVGNDTGGAVCQLVLGEDPSRIGALVLTDCDAFDDFPPFPFGLLVRAVRHPGLGRALLLGTRSARVRNSVLGFGALVRRRLSAAESEGWVTPYLTEPGVRRDVAAFARAWTGKELSDSARWLSRFEGPVLLCWAARDWLFPIAVAERLLATFPDARLVEVQDAAAFVPLDQPTRVAEEIARFLG